MFGHEVGVLRRTAAAERQAAAEGTAAGVVGEGVAVDGGGDGAGGAGTEGDLDVVALGVGEGVGAGDVQGEVARPGQVDAQAVALHCRWSPRCRG